MVEKKIIQIKENLRIFYNAIINIAVTDVDFFICLGDYVRFIKEEEETNKIINDVIQSEEDERVLMKNYEKKAIGEIRKVLKNLEKYLEVKNIKDPRIAEILDDMYALDRGHMFSSVSEVERLFGDARDIISILFHGDHKEEMHNYVTVFEDSPENIQFFSFSKSYNLYSKEKQLLNEKDGVALWSLWNYLALAYLAKFQAEEYLHTLEKEENNWFNTANFNALVREMRLLGTEKNIFFVRKSYVQYVTRIHNHLMKELPNIGARRTIKKQEILEVSFLGKEIKTIEIKKSDLQYFIVINGEIPYKAQVKKGGNQYWEYIYKIAKDGSVELSDVSVRTGILSFFNTSNANPLYKKGLVCTKVIAYRSDFLYPGDGVSIQSMKPKTYKKYFE